MGGEIAAAGQRRHCLHGHTIQAIHPRQSVPRRARFNGHGRHRPRTLRPMHFLRLALLSSVALAAACSPDSERATPHVARTAGPDEAVMAFLADEMAGRGSTAPTMFVARTVDGGQAHPRITVAYLGDPDWCGSGGCTLLVVEAKREGPVLLGRTTIT